MLSATLLMVAGMSAPMIRLEAPQAELSGGAALVEAGGVRFATGFTKPEARVLWRFQASAGLYRATIGYRTPGGPKGFDLSVNGRKTSGMFPEKGSLAEHDAGLVELVDGTNEAFIEKGWGYYDIASLTLTPAPPPRALKPVPATLVNPKASSEARALMRSLVQNYGKVTISGQTGDGDAEFVAQTTGQRPAMIGGDLMDYSPSRVERGADPGGEVEKLIALARKGHIITLHWHWNAPKDLVDKEITRPDGSKENLLWYRGFYTNATTFDVEKALADPNSEGYRLLLRDIDAIAKELKKFADAKVPVIWRPLHEAEGKWFWWGARGPEPCKRLWRLLYTRLTDTHGLHNLIWNWNSAAPEWYPGDDVVDMVTIDAYPSDWSDPLSGTWERLVEMFDGKKLLGLGEFPGAYDVDRGFRFGVRWSYFLSWIGDLGPRKNDPAVLKRIYSSPRVLTLEEWRGPQGR